MTKPATNKDQKRKQIEPELRDLAASETERRGERGADTSFQSILRHRPRILLCGVRLRPTGLEGMRTLEHGSLRSKREKSTTVRRVSSLSYT